MTRLPTRSVEQIVRVVKTAKAKSVGGGIPTRERTRIGSLVRSRTLRVAEDVGGEGNLTRGGSAHWARAGRDARVG